MYHIKNSSQSKKNLVRLSTKLENTYTAPKTYWSSLNRFVSNKNIPIIRHILVDGKVLSNLAEKPNFSIHILLLNALQ